MNRTVAALASSIALAVAACGPAPAPPFTDVTFFWNFQDRALPTPNVYGDFTAGTGCGSANVDTVRVTMTGPAGPWTQLVSCFAVNSMPGATFTNLPVGPYTWFIEGIRQNLTVFSVSGSGDVVNFPIFDVTMLAIFPNMNLWYELPPGGTCVGVTEIGFALVSGPGQANSVVEYSSDNVMVTCQPPPNNGFTMPSIPSGNFTYGLLYMEAWQSVGPPLYQTCQVGYPSDPPPLIQTVAGSGYHIGLGLGTGAFCPR